jgi:BTB/POZ domain
MMDTRTPSQQDVPSDLLDLSGAAATVEDDRALEAAWSDDNVVAVGDAFAAARPSYPHGVVGAEGSLNPFLARPLVQRPAASASIIPALSPSEHSSTQAIFESPMRSMLVSSPPTSSISANTAHASLSAAPASSSSSTFAALANAGARRVASKPNDSAMSLPVIGSSSNAPIIAMEKDLDDPGAVSAGSVEDARTLNTSATLSRLFAADESLTPAPISRNLSQLRTLSGAARGLDDTSTLTGHLFHNGFLEGRHSDITVYAFGESYKLHKLLLDRVPFFSSAFSGGWAESNAREMVLHPEDIDANITKTAFELAIKKIYGTTFPPQEDEAATSLFATACWLNMPELVDSCVDSILRQMQTATLHELIKLVTNSYYGKAGDRILSSAKALLCREGWEMPYSAWDNIPSEIIREILGGDPFFVSSEWERWFLATKILNRKLKAKALDAGLISSDGHFLYPKPSSLRFFAVRFDTVYRRESGFASARHVAEKDEPWVALYTSPDISPLLVLLDEGIHYVHLRFEQLQQIRSHRDIFGVPVLPEKVISDALWMALELRQRIMNAHENDLELGLTELADEEDLGWQDEPATLSISSKGKQLATSPKLIPEDNKVESDSWDGNGRPRKFWIPSNDVSCIMGGMREANLSGSSVGGVDWSNQAARFSTGLEPSDVAWASDFVLDGGRPLSQSLSNPAPPRYSNFPPFRFSAEFPSPRTLQEKKRVYSHTVFYLGSLWNLYIQRQFTKAKTPQLGIYLHRAKESSPSDDPLAHLVPASVDDRIGQLEREMLLRKTQRRNRLWRDSDSDNPSSAGFGRRPKTNVDERLLPSEIPLAQKDEGPEQIRSTLTSPDYSSLRSPTSRNARLLDSDAEDEELLRANRRHNVPAMPPYLDSRPVIKTYFKIYSPDKNGRLLSIYESSPEKFVVSKSWGWKSSQATSEDGSPGHDMGRAKDGKLRYMVVIGNV